MLTHVRNMYLPWGKCLKGPEIPIKLSISSKVNLVKLQWTYLGHVVGYRKILPQSVKVQSIMDYPKGMREVRFWTWLDITGNFVHTSLRSLYPWLICLRRNVNLCGLQNGKQHLSKLTWILSTKPVLQAPDFNKPFSLAISASNVGVGVVLL